MGKSSSRANNEAIKRKYGFDVTPGTGKVTNLKELNLVGAQKRMADRHNLGVFEGDMSGSLQGLYDPNENRVVLSRKALNRDVTLIHEIGHGKDHNQTGGPTKSNSKAFNSIPKSEINKVVVNRFNRMVHPEDRARTISQVRARTSKSYYDYLTSNSEVFADAYGQFINGGASSFRSSAPKLYNYLQSVRTI